MLIYLAFTDRDFRHQVATNGLQQAKDTIRNNMFWFGITEHYDASICLLMYQLKKIDKIGLVVKYGDNKKQLTPFADICIKIE